VKETVDMRTAVAAGGITLMLFASSYRDSGSAADPVNASKERLTTAADEVPTTMVGARELLGNGSATRKP